MITRAAQLEATGQISLRFNNSPGHVKPTLDPTLLSTDITPDRCLQMPPLFNHTLKTLIHSYSVTCVCVCVCGVIWTYRCVCVTTPNCKSFVATSKKPPTITTSLLCYPFPLYMGSGRIWSVPGLITRCLADSREEMNPLVCDIACREEPRLS